MPGYNHGTAYAKRAARHAWPRLALYGNRNRLWRYFVHAATIARTPTAKTSIYGQASLIIDRRPLVFNRQSGG